MNSGGLCVTSEWTMVAWWNEANPPITHLCVMKRGSNRAEMVNGKGKMDLQLKNVMKRR